MKQSLFTGYICSMVLLFGCKDAPRDNPLDPLSPQYSSTAAVQGVVTILNLATPLASASIVSLEDGITTQTDAAGTFSFENLSLGYQTLVCMKENFTPDTQRVVLQTRSTRKVNFTLNGAPYVLSQNIYTRKIDQYYPSPQYFVDVFASVTDPNGITDLDSVWFAIQDTILFPMTYSVSTKLFQTTLYRYDLPTNTTQWLVSRPLRIRSKDIHSAINLSAPFYVSRIIENTATPTYPTTNTTTSIKDTTGSTPLLKWTPPDVTFNYTYSLAISRVESGTRSAVWACNYSFYSELQFPANGTGEQTLRQGEYVWTISVVDEFGNYSRSKEASFIVK